MQGRISQESDRFSIFSVFTISLVGVSLISGHNIILHYLARELYDVVYRSSLSVIGVLHCLYACQWLMVGLDCEFFAFQVIAEMLWREIYTSGSLLNLL